MCMVDTEKKTQFITKRSALFWDIDSAYFGKLSDEAIIERIFMYGNLSDYNELFQLFGKSYCKQIFEKLIQKERVTLRAPTINYLNLILSDVS